MADRLFIEIKVGDLNPTDPVKSMMDGMLIDYIDDPGGVLSLTGFHIFSEKAFAIIEVDRKYKPLIVDALQSLNYNPDAVVQSDLYRKRKGVFVLDDFKALISSDIVDKWRGDDQLAPIDMRAVDISKLIKNSADFGTKEIVIDNNLVTTGSFTIGSDPGDDYPTHAAADADTGNLTGDIDFTCTSNIVESAYGNWTVVGTGRNFDLINGSPHGGDPTAGYIVSIDHNDNGIGVALSGAMTRSVTNYNIKRTTAGAAVNDYLMALTGNPATVTTISNIFLDGGGLQGRAISSTAAIVRIFNFIVWDCGGGGMYFTGAAFGENGLCYGHGAEGISTGSDPDTWQNVSSFGNTGNDWALISAATGYNNADSDGTGADGNWSTGANNNPSLTPATEMELDDTQANFGYPKAGGTVKGSGKVPTYAVNDMSSVAYASPYPTGPKMYAAAAGGPPVGTLSMMGVGR